MLYLNNGNELDINPCALKTIGAGCFGTVLKIDDFKCLKILNFDHLHYYTDTMKPELFKTMKGSIDAHMEIIKDNEYKNLCKIYELYYNSIKRLGGYSMELLKREYYSIENLSEQYILNSLLNLLETSKKLSQQHILMKDVKTYNTILTKSGVYLIDFDLYSYSPNLSIRELNYENETQILELFRSLSFECIISFGINRYVLNLHKLFDYQNNNRSEVINNIIDTLDKKKVLTK